MGCKNSIVMRRLVRIRESGRQGDCAVSPGVRAASRPLRSASESSRRVASGRVRGEALIRSLSRRASKARGVVESHEQVACLLQHPGRVRLAGDSEVLDAAAADGNECEHVERAQEDRVDGEEVAGEDRFAMRPEEGAPRLRIAPRCRRQSRLDQDVANQARGDSDAELTQLASDPTLPPADRRSCLT